MFMGPEPPWTCCKSGGVIEQELNWIHKEIAEANFALHETHCSRFLCLCPDCGEAVHRELLDQHKEEQHTQVRCSKCNQKMERRDLLDHESNDCVERLQSCQFCELEMPWKELDEHCLVCGSRTELCGDCRHYVKLRDRPEHAVTCSAADNGSGPPQTTSKPPPDQTKVTVSCNRSTSIPAEDIDKHELECGAATLRDDEEAVDEEGEREDEEEVFRQGTLSRLSSTYKSTSLSYGPRRGPWVDEDELYQICTCPHCHLALPLVTLRWHKAKCKIHILL
ncbi:hypothetical protein L3Q82_019005, partial [Scortum barcoo]